MIYSLTIEAVGKLGDSICSKLVARIVAEAGNKPRVINSAGLGCKPLATVFPVAMVNLQSVLLRAALGGDAGLVVVNVISLHAGLRAISD